TVGLSQLKRICEQVRLPVIGSGGIGVAEVSAVIAAGAHGIAVLGAVCLAPDPVAATVALRRAVDAAVAEGKARG
ncbi:MAG: thiamine phosphate synthase, partial [Myxococcota bacterium]